jgi:signal transduction histidine kinase
LITEHKPFKNVVHRYRHKNGSLVIIESSGFPVIDSEGKFRGYRGIDRDVTDRYKLEAEREGLIANLQKNKSDLEKAKKELEKTKAELEALNVGLEKNIEERTKDLRSAQEKLIRSEKLAALGKVAGSLSHELRNPLGVISNAIYYITSPGVTIDNVKLDKYLNIMKTQIRDANSIIETALEFARPKSMVFKKNNLNECIDKALDKLTLPECVTIKKNYGQNLDVVFDASYMQQAIVDIVKNSIEAIEKEGVIEITTLREASNIKIIVADNGKGIDKNDVALIFEPLFSRKSRGIGLGLSTVKDIINAHNGTVSAESAPDAGAKIIIIFPARENA